MGLIVSGIYIFFLISDISNLTQTMDTKMNSLNWAEKLTDTNISCHILLTSVYAVKVYYKMHQMS